MPVTMGNIEVTVAGTRVYEWQVVQGTKNIRFNAGFEPTVGQVVEFTYYALGRTDSVIGTDYLPDGGSLISLGYENQLIDGRSFTQADGALEANFSGVIDRSRFSGLATVSFNADPNGPACPVGSARDSSTDGRWNIYYGDHQNGNSTQPGWFKTANATRFFCNITSGTPTLEEIRDIFVNNWQNAYNGGTITTFGTLAPRGSTGFIWYLGEADGGLTSITKTTLAQNIGDTSTVTGVLPFERWVTSSLFTNTLSDKISLADNSTLLIDNANVVKFNKWLQPNLSGVNTNLIVTNGSKLQMEGSKWQVVGEGLAGDDTIQNGLYFELSNGASYDVKNDNVTQENDTDISGFAGNTNVNARVNWFPAFNNQYQGKMEVNFQDSIYQDTGAPKTSYGFAPGIYNNHKVIYNKSEGSVAASALTFSPQDRILDNFSYDIINLGSQDLQILPTVTQIFVSPDPTNPRYISFNLYDTIPGSETADGMDRVSTGTSATPTTFFPPAWWNMANFRVGTQAIHNRVTWRDFQPDPAPSLETFRPRACNLSFGNWLYQGPDLPDGSRGLAPYSAYDIGYAYDSSQGGIGVEQAGYGTVSMWNSYNAEMLYGGQPLDSVIDSAYYENRTVEDLKVCIEGMQGLANQPEGSGHAFSAGTVQPVFGEAYPEAGGVVPYPDMVTNVVNTSANVFDNTQGGIQNHPWNPTDFQENIAHSVGGNGDTTITATTANQAGQLESGSTFIQHSSTSVTAISSGLTITSVGGATRWTSGLPQPADLSAVNGIQIVGSGNTYETSVTINI